ncbi:MAG: class I SAM-dependent methyltransferase [Acidimicrobiales bacterium]
MRRPGTPAALQAIDAFADAPPGDRLHVRVRWLTCPFAAVEREVPVGGRVLEIGCGHGLLSLYLAASAPGRAVHGVDVDEHKIALARGAASRFAAAGGGSVSFDVVRPGVLPDGPFDAVVVADVLYLLSPEARADLLEAAVGRLAPQGRIVVKEADRVPRWKGALTVGQELLSTRVLHITQGDEVAFAPPDELAAPLRRAGLDVVIRRADRGYVHPHVLLVARAGDATVPS